jgi:glycosyltransferase involved in cell wall biosynthesis
MTYAVAIVTRNRVNDLQRCLGSIMKQRRLPDQIIVVDNASTDKTNYMCTNFRKVFDIDYVYCQSIGIPHARNAALDACKTGVICFLDDDCEADGSWVLELAKYFERDNKVAAVQGYIGNFYPNNVPAQLKQFQRDMIIPVSVFNDTVIKANFCAAGNLACRMDFVNQNKLRFYSKLAVGEEIDFAKQIMKCGGQIGYTHEAIVFHKWRTSPFSYLKRLFRSGIGKHSMVRLANESMSPKFTSGFSKKHIWKLAIDYANQLKAEDKIFFLLLLVFGNLSKKAGYAYGSIFKR